MFLNIYDCPKMHCLYFFHINKMCYTVSQAQWPTKESRQMQVLCDVVFLSSVPFSYWDTSEGFTFTQTIKFYHYFNFFLFYLKKKKRRKEKKSKNKNVLHNVYLWLNDEQKITNCQIILLTI